MTKQSGLGSALWFGSVDLSGDVGAVETIETTRAVESVSAINQSAEDRILTLRDGTLGFTSFWDVAAGGSVLTLQALPRTDVQVSVALGTPAVGTACASMVAKQTTLTPDRGADGSLRLVTSASGSGYGLEHGELLTTGKQTFASGAANGTSIDIQSMYAGLTTTAFGAAAYLHVFSLGSGTPTLTVKDSADNGTFAVLSPTSLAFSPTVAGVERQQTGITATIRRYVRVEVSGTYTALVCALSFVRYTESAA